MGQTLSEPVIEKVNTSHNNSCRLHHHELPSLEADCNQAPQNLLDTQKSSGLTSIASTRMKVPMTASSMAYRPCKDGA